MLPGRLFMVCQTIPDKVLKACYSAYKSYKVLVIASLSSFWKSPLLHRFTKNKYLALRAHLMV